MYQNAEQLNTYDVAIIGGGLAGLATGIQLADSGKKVVLFEKKHYPFHRVCGEYISMESWGFLNRLGLDLASVELPIISKLNISSPSGKLLSHELDPGGFGISRYKLDAMMADVAIKSGVDLQTGTSVTSIAYDGSHWQISAGGQNYKAKLTVGCFGKKV